MRLHPAVTETEAYAWLKAQVEHLAPNAQIEDLETTLQQLASDIAALSSVVLPDEVEPLFP